MRGYILPFVGLMLAVLLAAAPDAGAQQRKLNPFAKTDQNEPPTAKAFFELCRSANSESQATCGNFVLSMVAVYTRIGESHAEHRVVCPPSEMTNEQARRMILGWADMNPDGAERPLPMAVLSALTTRYPCAKYLKLPQ